MSIVGSFEIAITLDSIIKKDTFMSSIGSFEINII